MKKLAFILGIVFLTSGKFADVQQITITGTVMAYIIDDGESGHGFVGNWGQSGVSGGYQGDCWYDTQESSADQSIWTFTGLASGAYDVLATWRPHANRATNAPYALSGGSATTTVLPPRLSA